MTGRNLHQNAPDEAIPESVTTERIGKRNVTMNGKGIGKANGIGNANVSVNGTVTGTVTVIVTATVIVSVIESAIGNASVIVTETERETAKGIEIVSVIVTITVVVAVAMIPETHDMVVATKAKETIAMMIEEMLAVGTIVRKDEAPSTTKIVVEIVAPIHAKHATANATLPRRGSHRGDAIHGLGQGHDRLTSLPLHRIRMPPLKRRYHQ